MSNLLSFTFKPRNLEALFDCTSKFYFVVQHLYDIHIFCVYLERKRNPSGYAIACRGSIKIVLFVVRNIALNTAVQGFPTLSETIVQLLIEVSLLLFSTTDCYVLNTLTSKLPVNRTITSKCLKSDFLQVRCHIKFRLLHSSSSTEPPWSHHLFMALEYVRFCYW